MDYISKCKSQTIKHLEENRGGESSRTWIWQLFLRYDTKSIRNKRKNKLGIIKIKTCAAK